MDQPLFVSVLVDLDFSEAHALLARFVELLD